MSLKSKDTHWQGTITEYHKNAEEKQRQWRESSDRVKFVTKLTTVYDFLEKQKRWAYSTDELIDALSMNRSTIKHTIKFLRTFGAVEEQLLAGVKYYIFSTKTDVPISYKAALVKKYRGWRIDSAEIAKDMIRKGLENVGEDTAS